MGKKTKIDWCDSSWNPVTGCLHGCEYCYARRIAERFGCHQMPVSVNYPILYEPVRNTDTYAYMRAVGISAGKIQPYPFDFTPTFHRYRLQEPELWRKPRTIFVCSMADLFGDWVPDEWIISVFNTCRIANWHRYLFLTKNPKRYLKLAERGILPNEDNFWFGTSVPTPETSYFFAYKINTFTSIEPLHDRFGRWDFEHPGELPRWIIIGAETGNRKGKIIPEKAWVDEIARQAKENSIPVFMKESLRGIMGDDFRQEYPWEARP